MKKIGTIIILIAVFIGYFIYISYYSFDMTAYKIKSDKIINDVNVVMISDVHDDHCKIQTEIIQEIENIQPDLIFCVGDMIDEHSKSDEDILNFLASLTEIAPVYLSLGNHDLAFYQGHLEDLDKYKEIGVHVLDKSYEDIEVNGNRIRIGGLYDYAFSNWTGDIKQADMKNNATYQFLSDATNTDRFLFMLAHRPDSFIFAKARKWDIDLVLSGHLHGGQVILPFIGGLFAPEQGWFPKVDFGHYQMGNIEMIVTRGISSGGERFPRLNNPCEIVQITLTRS